MTSIPLSGLSTSFAYSFQREQSAELTAVNTKTGEQSHISVSASSSVTITGKIDRSLAYAPNGVAKYEAIGDAQPKSQAANNILSFISLRLQQDTADGASSEEIASRLQAGYEGFLQGFSEAFEQLVGTGLLSPEIEHELELTKEAVLAGIAALAEEYGVDSPVAGKSKEDTVEKADKVLQLSTAPVVSYIDPRATFAKFAAQLVKPGEDLAVLLDSTTINYEALAKRDFSFSLRTQDGDTVTISAASTRVERGDRSGSDSAQSSSFNLQVDGELDEDELAAISHLLDQVGKISEAFFDWDIEQAFALALDIGFDESEIAGFSLNLRQELTTIVESSHKALGDDVRPHEGMLESLQDSYKAEKGDHRIKRLMNFVKMLEDIAYKADELGIKKSDVTSFASELASANHDSHAAGNKLASFMDKMLKALT